MQGFSGLRFLYYAFITAPFSNSMSSYLVSQSAQTFLSIFPLCSAWSRIGHFTSSSHQQTLKLDYPRLTNSDTCITFHQTITTALRIFNVIYFLNRMTMQTCHKMQNKYHYQMSSILTFGQISLYFVFYISFQNKIGITRYI